MRIALDISSTRSDHRFRGIGTYTSNLLDKLKVIASKNKSLELVTFTNQIPTADLYHFPAFNPFYLSFPINLINKSIVTIHDLIPIEYSKNFPVGIKGGLRWNFQKLLLPYFRAIITDSQASAQSIRTYINIKDSKLHVIYLAVDKNFSKLRVDAKQIIDTKNRLKPPKHFVLYTGDLNWNKNIVRLAKVCIKMNLPLVIVGKQAVNSEIDRKHPWNQELVTFQDLALNHNNLIIRYGYVNQDDLISLYNLASCYVQPSIAEGFGLPVLEALACGCPVLCSQLSSLPEIAADAALYFDPFNETDLENKINYIMNHPQNLKLYIDKGYQQVKKFSWEETAVQTWKIYQQLI